MTTEHQQPHSDLNWVAFQYIAGELSPSDAEHFEEQLASDLDAQEAVAKAVRLAETTALALAVAPVVASTVSLASRRWWSTPVVWSCYALAATVAIAVTLAGIFQAGAGRDDRGVQVVEGNGEVRELALAWATGRTDLMSEVADSTEEALGSSGADTEDVEAIETPSWMLIAVAGLTQAGAGVARTDQPREGQ